VSDELQIVVQDLHCSFESKGNPISNAPLVSVIVPVYNGKNHILEAIHSALSQELDGFSLEVLVFDNGSVDGTAEALEMVSDERLTVYHSKGTIPGPANWNRVSSLAKGDFIKLLPADDVLLKGCLQEQATTLSRDASLALVASPRILISPKGRKLLRPLGALPIIGKKNGEDVRRLVVKKAANIIGETAGVMFSRPAFLETLPWSDDKAYVIDLDFYLRALKFGDYFGLTTYGAKFRLSPNSWSASFAGKQSQHLISLLEEELLDLGLVDSRTSKLLRELLVRLRSSVRRIVNLAFRML
jgi:glycosyltransferase involved in cell wall biosynthesis